MALVMGRRRHHSSANVRKRGGKIPPVRHLSAGAVLLLCVLSLSAAAVQEIASPAAPGAAASFLSVDEKGGVLMSWMEPSSGGKTSIRFSRHDGKSWSTPRTIFESGELFVNWADFPSIVPGQERTLIAHWLQRSGKSTYAYDVRYAVSKDGGSTWSKPMLLNRDGKQVEHGFASIVAGRHGRFAAVWLDGREMPEGKEEGEMTVRYAEIDANGRISNDLLIDKRTCECCTTAATRTSEGVLAAYRDRSQKEVRDIAIFRVAAGKATSPYRLHDDGWEIAGCPVNGPQIDANGGKAAVAWFTGAKNQSRVNVAFSNDSGKSFAEPIRIDDGAPMGRVDVLMLPNGDALAIWMEGLGNAAQVVARRVSPSRKLGPIVKLADSSSARSSGFPRAVLAGNKAWFTWTEPAMPKRVHVAVTDVGAF